MSKPPTPNPEDTSNSESLPAALYPPASLGKLGVERRHAVVDGWKLLLAGSRRHVRHHLHHLGRGMCVGALEEDEMGMGR